MLPMSSLLLSVTFQCSTQNYPERQTSHLQRAGIQLRPNMSNERRRDPSGARPNGSNITSDIYLRLKTPSPTFLFLFKDIVSCSSSYTLSPLVTKDGLELPITCLSLLRARITGRYHHARFMQVLGVEPRASCMLERCIARTRQTPTSKSLTFH